jgi:superfamily II RNA helicase
LGDKTKKTDHAFWDDPFGKDDDTNLEAFLDWEPDTPNRGTFATAQSRFSGGSEQTVSDEKQSPDDDVLEVDEGLIQADARRRRTAVRWNDASNDRSEDTLTLTDLGQTSSKLRGENELWLGVALSSDTVVGLTAEQIAGVAGALCCDSNRPTSCVYGPSVQLDDALESLMPSGSEIASLQFENEMDAPVNLSRPVAALVEAWAAGSSWDQVRRDTNLDEGDVARVFRRTAELLTQVPRTRELPMEVRQAARRAGELVLRPPITDLS